jgi:transcriptional regulator with XRE-family HTH domain
MDIGRRIREEREALGMQRVVLARRVGVVPQHLYLIENGERTPSIALLVKVAEALRVEPASLLQESGEGDPGKVPASPPSSAEDERRFDDAFEAVRTEADELRTEWLSTAQRLADEVESAEAASDTGRLWRLLGEADTRAQRASEDFKRLLVGPMTRLTDAAWKLPSASASVLRRHALASLATVIRNDAHALKHAASVAESALDSAGELAPDRAETGRRKDAEAAAEAAYSNVVNIAVESARRRGTGTSGPPATAPGESQAG